MFVNYWISQLSIFCASYILLCSKNLAPWLTYIYDITVSLGQASVPSIAGASVSGCHKAAAELWGRTAVSSEAWLGRICFQAHIVVGGINLLLGCQTKALGCLLAISWRPLTYSWYRHYLHDHLLLNSHQGHNLLPRWLTADVMESCR